MKRNKKGFTIVELVIVIAVIAILAAVLIPTFSSLINKAKESSDTALVKNLNIIMAADEAENGKSETMSEALAAAESAGYTIEKITPTSSGDILWDEQNNRFVLKKADGTYYAENGNVTEGVNLWKITDDLGEVAENSNHYSYYLKGTEITGAVTAKAGVDVGENSADVNYANAGAAQTVTIRMNGGKLTVNAPNDTVNSYGEKESVDITAVASASYHENGKVVGNIEVKKGRVELGAGAEVNTVLVSSAAAGDVKVDVLAGAKVGSVAPTTDEAKEDIAASTSIPADSKVEEVVGEEVKSFAGGLGTENSPYLIATAEQFNKIALFEEDMCQPQASQTAYYFSLVNDIDLSGETYEKDYICEMFVGGIQGNGHKIYANDSLKYFFEKSGNAVYSDFEIVLTDELVLVYCPDGSYECDSITFDGVNYSSRTGATYKIGHNESLYISYNSVNYLNGKYDWRGYFTVQNCKVDLNLEVDTAVLAQASAAVFFGAYVYDRGNTSVTIKNCAYSGIFRAPYLALVLNNGQGDVSLLNVSGIANNGSLLGTLEAHLVAGQGDGDHHADFYDSIVNEGTGTINKITAEGLAVSVDDNNNIVITRESAKDAEKYVVQIFGMRKAIDATGYSPFSNYNYGIKFEITALQTTDEMTTDITLGKILDKKTATEQYGIDLTGAEWIAAVEEDVTYAIVEHNGEVYYVFNFDVLSQKSGYIYEMNVSKPQISLEAYKNGSVFGLVTHK